LAGHASLESNIGVKPTHLTATSNFLK
jgi:hypothetical protein